MRWSADKANRWWAGQPRTMGCNFTPSSAINQLEMWQAASFDLPRIETELALAASIGMNAVRVYLHDLLWIDGAAGLLMRMEAFLAAADRHGIRTMFVLFDSCWHPEPKLGPQPKPRPGVHNSGWVQAPGMSAMRDPAQRGRLEAYVRGVVGRFSDDTRVLAWDVWNEPDNGPEVSLCDAAELADKAALVLPLMRDAFGWAHEMQPVQPLTSAIWLGDWSSRDRLTPLQQAQTDMSDVISFHNYGSAEDFGRRVAWLRALGRPLLCTEFMARPAGSTFEAILPVARASGVGTFCWGLVRGKTQTHLPWDSWENPNLAGLKDKWFHDIFEVDGAAHDPQEIEFLRLLTAIEAETPCWPLVAAASVRIPPARIGQAGDAAEAA
jgi:hypothetical protein